MKLFLLLFIILFLGGNFYVFYRAWHAMPLNIITKTLIISFGIVAVSSIFLFFIFGEKMSIGLASLTYKIGSSWLFVFIYFFLINLVMDLVRATRLVPKDTLNHYTKDNWLSFALILGFVTLLMVCGYLRYKSKERVELPIKVEKSLGTLDSLKIVAISDLHLGYTIGKDELQEWVALINNENPDLILIAGDIIDNNLRPILAQNMQDDLRKLKAKYGVYAVAGNHEYISGIAQSRKFINDAGIHLLTDQSVLIDSTFYIVGRDDRSNKNRKSLDDLTSSLDKNKTIILLDHQPYHLEESEKAGIDLQVSGHTHQGQVWPISLITDQIYEKSHGYLKKGNTNIYVSSGIGIWGGKFRIGTQSEYVVINIRNR